MIKRIVLVIILTTVGMVIPTMATTYGACKMHKVAGSYTRTTSIATINGPQNYLVQLNLSADGIATRFVTFFPEMAQTYGKGTESSGSWTCLRNGKVLVTVIDATFLPTAIDIFTGLPAQDLTLARHARRTFQYSVVDNDTLNLTDGVTRFYQPADDPGDPAAGVLGTPFTADVDFSRVPVAIGDLP